MSAHRLSGLHIKHKVSLFWNETKMQILLYVQNRLFFFHFMKKKNVLPILVPGKKKKIKAKLKKLQCT